MTGKATASAGSPISSSSAPGTTNASGATTISVPAPTSTYTGAATVAFTVLGPGGGADATLTAAMPTLAVTYSASGDVTSLTVKNAQTNSNAAISGTSTLTSYPTILVPYGGTAGTGSGTAGT